MRLADHRRRGADHAGHRAQLRDFRAVVGDAGGLVDEDVRGRSEDARLQLALQAGHQRQRDDQRHHADGDAERRDQRDDGDEHLPAFGQQIAERDLQLERHDQLSAFSSRLSAARPCSARGRISGNRITSRIDGELREQHHQAIDADAFAAGRRHAVFERAHVVLVHRVRFLIAGGALGELRLRSGGAARPDR